MEVNLTGLTFPQATAEHGLKVATAGSQHCAVAGKGAAASMEQDVGEKPLLPQRVEVHKDAVGIGGLVKKVDVHGAGAGSRFSVLMDAHGHFH